MTRETAEKIVEAIVNDMSDRGGIGNEWESIDGETQDSIKATWVKIILRIS